ncbi:MAG: hypothetical protein F6K41_12470 [Symploca sp. SIO3E6]|nr:hypothetical protein [Caldora sp. SIO3E6]
MPALLTTSIIDLHTLTHTISPAYPINRKVDETDNVLSILPCGKVGTRGRGDVGTWGRGDAGTRGRGDMGDKGDRGDTEDTEDTGDKGDIYQFPIPNSQFPIPNADHG